VRKTVKILYFSCYEWSNMGRRKVRLAYEFARQPDVAAVLYVEPPVTTSVLDLARGRFEPGHVASSRRAHSNALLGRPRHVEEKVWAYTGSTKTVPLSRFDALRRMEVLKKLNLGLYVRGLRRCLAQLPGGRVVLWLTHPLQVFALDAFPERALLCYDWTDDWAEFDWLPVEDGEELIAWNDRIVRRADVVFAVSEELTRRAQALNSHVHRAPNATDLDVIGAASQRDGPIAPELAGLPRPIIGYVGQIADKMDYELVGQVAQARPDWSFCFVGPVWSTKQEQVAALEVLGNVHFLGVRPFDALVDYLRGFDVCTLPHAISPLTRSMDPIKLYDYLATGKPIVSTRVAGVERFANVVHIGDTADTFLTGLERALRENGALRQRRMRYAEENAWPRRAEQMWEAIVKRLEGGGGAGCPRSV
jgi:glycosyltransferase involved in cell wall biosynthesis